MLINDMNIKANDINWIRKTKLEFFGYMFKIQGAFDMVDYDTYFIIDMDSHKMFELYQYHGDRENYYLITDKEQFTDLEFYGYSL